MKLDHYDVVVAPGDTSVTSVSVVSLFPCDGGVLDYTARLEDGGFSHFQYRDHTCELMIPDPLPTSLEQMPSDVRELFELDQDGIARLVAEKTWRNIRAVVTTWRPPRTA